MSKPANESYLLQLRRNRTHTISIVPHDLRKESTNNPERVRDVKETVIVTRLVTLRKNIREHYDFVVVMHM